MTILKAIIKERRRLMKILQRFEEAVRAHEMKGAMDPADWDNIQQEYESAKTELYELLGFDKVDFTMDSTNHT